MIGIPGAADGEATTTTLDTTVIAHPRSRPRLRRLGWGIVALIVAGFLYLNRGEWPEIAEAARTARPGYLALAALLQACSLVCFSASFWGGLNAVGVRLPFGATLATAWACNFLNMVMKAGGMAGLAIFVRAAGRRGYAGSRTVLGYLLTLAIGYVVFILLVGLALTLLWLGGDARWFEVAAAAATLTALAAVMAGGVYIVRSPARVQRLYGWLAGTVNRGAGWVRRGPVLDPAGGERVAAEARQGTALLCDRPSRLAPAVAATLLKDTTAIAVLYAVLLAFDAGPSVSLVIVAYALTLLFSYISIVPSGLGVVELSLTALLIRVGVPTGAAVLTTVGFRFFQFWVPFLAGAAAVRFVGGNPQSTNGSAIGADTQVRPYGGQS